MRNNSAYATVCVKCGKSAMCILRNTDGNDSATGIMRTCGLNNVRVRVMVRVRLGLGLG